MQERCFSQHQHAQRQDSFGAYALTSILRLRVWSVVRLIDNFNETMVSHVGDCCLRVTFLASGIVPIYVFDSFEVAEGQHVRSRAYDGLVLVGPANLGHSEALAHLVHVCKVSDDEKDVLVRYLRRLSASKR